jgi:hypothetical protein
MNPFDELADVLDPSTAAAWPIVAEVSPPDGMLMGGTALAVHLRHRQSRDLDVFTASAFDPDALEQRLRRHGPLATILKSEGTLNAMLGSTKVQFLWAVDQDVLESPTVVAGMRIGSLSDLFATKLKVIADRGELRDFFDLMAIEEHTGRRVEEGLQLYLARYRVDPAHASVAAIVRGLGYFGDVTDDPALRAVFGEGVRARVEAYWARRQPEIVASFDARG